MASLNKIKNENMLKASPPTMPATNVEDTRGRRREKGEKRWQTLFLLIENLFGFLLELVKLKGDILLDLFVNFFAARDPSLQLLRMEQNFALAEVIATRAPRQLWKDLTIKCQQMCNYCHQYEDLQACSAAAAINISRRRIIRMLVIMLLVRVIVVFLSSSKHYQCHHAVGSCHFHFFIIF